MRFHQPAFFSTPIISGAIEGYGVSMFASEHSELDDRSQRRLTAVEVSLQTNLPFSCAVASGGMVAVVDRLDLRHEYKPTTKGWDNSYVLRTSDLKLAQLYFDEERAKNMVELMKRDKSWVVLMFIEDRGVLRLDTPLPIDNPRDIDVLVKKMIAVARTLEVSEGESKDMIRKRSEKVKQSSVLDVDEDLLTDHLGIELEED